MTATDGAGHQTVKRIRFYIPAGDPAPGGTPVPDGVKPLYEGDDGPADGRQSLVVHFLKLDPLYVVKYAYS